MLSLKKPHQEILYQKINSAIGRQISDDWERKLYRKMTERTVFRPVDELRGGPGYKVEGQNVHRVIIGPRGRGQIVGNIEVYISKEKLEKLKGLESRDPRLKAKAEDALHTVSHELAHNYFKAIGYEARMTRYLRDKPKVTESHLRRFLVKSGKYDVNTARAEAERQVKKNPLFWANYVAHTAHEAGADIMAAETVMQISRGRHATGQDLERLTAFRPYTIRELEGRFAGEGRLATYLRPRKPDIWEKMARKLERGSWEFMEQMGGLYNTSHISAGKKRIAEIHEMEGRHKRL